MAGAVLERELTSRKVQFRHATREDDAEIRALLRNNPMRGQISLSIEREPNYFIDVPGETRQTIIARHNSQLACIGACHTSRRFINGQPRTVGYLASLRLGAPFAGRFDILRRGYEFFHQEQSSAPADFYFTAIAADNIRARNFLERNLRGMPRYEFLTEFVSIVLPTRPSNKTFPDQDPNGSDAFLLEQNSRYQLAPASSFELDYIGRPDACAAIWDQRAFKQMVIRGYSPLLNATRPFLNLFIQPKLPPVGEMLPIAFITGLHAAPEILPDFLEELSARAYARGIKMLSFGFAANDPRLSAIRGGRRYHSRLYIVRWDDLGRPASELDNRIASPEAALL